MHIRTVNWHLLIPFEGSRLSSRVPHKPELLLGVAEQDSLLLQQPHPAVVLHTRVCNVFLALLLVVILALHPGLLLVV